MEKRVSQLTWLIGIITAIQVAGIPWAYNLQADVAVTRTKLEALEQEPGPGARGDLAVLTGAGLPRRAMPETKSGPSTIVYRLSQLRRTKDLPRSTLNVERRGVSV